MTASERKTARTLGPPQLRAIALRVQGLDISEIAREVGRDRTTVSRWFSSDPLVIEELDRRVADQYRTELAQHANLRAKAMEVIESALKAGDVRAALAILRLGARRETRPPAEGGTSSRNDSFGTVLSPIRQRDVSGLLRELEITRSWQIHVRRVANLLHLADPAADQEGILGRLLLLDEVASTVVRALEEANGEGLGGYSSLDGQQQQGLVGDARRATDEAWAIVGGDDDDDNDDDDDDEPQWPGEEGADRAIKLIGQALLAILGSLEGAPEAPEALEGGGGADGARLAARLTAARAAADLVIGGDQPPTVRSLADAVATLTTGFTDLVGALDEGATITVDAAWAEAAGGGQG